MFPTLVSFGDLHIQSHGALLLLGFMLALWHATVLARREYQVDAEVSIAPHHLRNAAWTALFWALMGAKLLYIPLHYHALMLSPRPLQHLMDGGFNFFGAALGASLFLWSYCRHHRLSLARFADLCAPGFALAYTFARIGCFLAGCCYGSACDLPWATRFPAHGHPGEMMTPCHPTQLYAAGANLLLFLLLDRWSRHRHPDGSIALRLIALYCLYRFVNDYFRVGASAELLAWGLTGAQLLCLALLPIVFFLERHKSIPASKNKDVAMPLSRPCGIQKEPAQ